jgi:2-polyprenyl-3-methyl-5-hydroxy-6-metoxy-1,4-benzoquinol methylase
MAVELKTASQEGYSREYYLQRDNTMFRGEVRHLLTSCHLKTGARVLEVGCGGGDLLRCCSSIPTVTTVGIDVNVQGMGLARHLAPQSALALADAACLPFADGLFDAVIAQHVIEHFDCPDAVLREWQRVLAPGGRIAVATPNAYYPDTELFDDPTHCHVYTLPSLVTLFDRNGFRVERAYSLMPYLGSRRLTWRLARLSMRSLLALRFLPGFSEVGLTLILQARKEEAAA